MIQNILLLCRAVCEAPFQPRRADALAAEFSVGEPARETLTDCFKPRRRRTPGEIPGSLRYFRLESCDH